MSARGVSATRGARLQPVHCARCRGQQVDGIVCKVNPERVVEDPGGPGDVVVQCRRCGQLIGLRVLVPETTPAVRSA